MVGITVDVYAMVIIDANSGYRRSETAGLEKEVVPKTAPFKNNNFPICKYWTSPVFKFLLFFEKICCEINRASLFFQNCFNMEW